MALLLDGNSKIGAQGRSNFCYLICLSHLNRSRAVINWNFSSEKINVIIWYKSRYKDSDPTFKTFLKPESGSDLLNKTDIFFFLNSE